MRKFLLAITFVGLLVVPVAAQDAPKAEIFGGYQYTHSNIEGFGLSFNGWNASVTGNFNNWLGVTGDFSGGYKSEAGASLHVYTYTFGPTISFKHDGPVNPFVHFLVGGATVKGSADNIGSGSVNGLAMMAGGGVDAKLTPHLAVRLAQADWAYYRIEGVSESKNVRISTGVVFRF